jgi:hypothetical protein
MNILLSFVLLIASIRPESGTFTIYSDGKKIGTEEFTITAERGGWFAQGRTRISTDGQSFDLRSRMRLNEELLPVSYEFETRGAVIKLNVGDPTSELEIGTDGKTQKHDIRFPAGGAIIDANFFHHYLLLLHRVGIGGKTVDVLIPREMTTGQLRIRDAGNRSFELETSDGRAVATTDADGRMLRLAFPDAKVVVER